MKALVQAIEKIRAKLPALRRHSLKETPTRTIVVDPVLEALGWDVRDPDEVQLEYPTVDGKSVDYALKINQDTVLLVEAKALDDPLTDVKAITQVVGYAANDGIVWCVLTNGIRWQVYRSVEKCPAPEKLMFGVDLDPKQSQGIPVQDLAEQLWRISRDEMARGTLDIEGEQTFTDSKVRKALDCLLLDPPRSLVSLLRRVADDNTLTPQKVRDSLARLWSGRSGAPAPPLAGVTPGAPNAPTRTHGGRATKRGRKTKRPGKQPKRDYGESHHTSGKPREVIELYRAVDQVCLSVIPGGIEKRFMKMSIRYAAEGRPFCWVCLQQGGIRVWLTLKYGHLVAPPDFARDVSSVGHWGGGDLELGVTSRSQLETATELVRRAFEAT